MNDALFWALVARWARRDKGISANLTGRSAGTPFGRGSGRQANHILRGTHRGRGFVAFEYTFRKAASLLTWRRGVIRSARTVRMLDFLCDVAEQVPGAAWSS